MKIKNVLVSYAKAINKEQKLALKAVKKTLKKYNIKYKVSKREKLKGKYYKNKDLILALGGDGTFLMTSHFIFDKTPLLGINSDPPNREGFFMESDAKNFEKKLKKILGGKFKIKKLHRLEAFIGNEKVRELALNEFYVASSKAYHTARYNITIKGKTERQKSSGVLVSAAAGSYAWIKSAGGKTMPLESDKIEYLIREPSIGRTVSKISLNKGILGSKEKVLIKFEFGKGVIIADSTGKEYKFDSEQKITIKMSKKPLNVITF